MIREDFITPMSGMQAIKPMQFWGSGKTNVENDESEMSFGDTLRSKIQNVKDLEQKSLASAYDISMGNTEDIESAMIDATKASVAIETAVQVTTRAVNAYKEIIQMQIDKGRKAAVYPVSESEWLDMGQLSELEKMRERLYGR